MDGCSNGGGGFMDGWVEYIPASTHGSSKKFYFYILKFFVFCMGGLNDNKQRLNFQ